MTFASLVPGGFYSADPDDQKVHRSIRTNNPGALNFSRWQKYRLGYVGVTQPDDSVNHNVTTIYRTPEHGVAAWYRLLLNYDFPDGAFTLPELATRYAGGPENTAAIRAYLAGWSRWMGAPATEPSPISVTDPDAMQRLAKAMFSHEAGMATPLHDNQIQFGVEREMAGTLPA